MVDDNYLGVFGHVVVDNIFRVPRLPQANVSVPTTGMEVTYGGTAGNIAMIAAHLGVRTALASFIGDDFPEEYESLLENAGIDLTDLNIIEGYCTPRAWIFVTPDHRQMTVFHQGPMDDAAKFDIQRHTIETSELIHLGTGRPEYYEKLAELASKLGKTISFDPAQEISYVYTPTFFRKIIGYANYFFANEDEISTALSYLDLTQEEDLLQFVKMLVITRGSQGSIIITQDERVAIPPIAPKKVVNITGAGDGYRAGFYAALQRGFDVERCGLIGSATASFIIESRGPQTCLPTWDQVLDRADKAQ